mgnify:CR=1 FL=1
MSFLDEQATGQIGIGEKANLSTLTRRKRKRKKGQAPTGAETYSLMPQDEFSNIVSSPTDIQQVGIGNLLQAQGSSAGKVPNVFEEYKSAAPIGSTIDAIYPQPDDDDDEEDDDDDEGTTDKLPQDINPSSNIYDMETQTGQDFKAAEDAREAFVTTAYQSAFATPRTFSEEFRSIVQGVTGSARSLGRDISKQDFESHAKTVEETRGTRDTETEDNAPQTTFGAEPQIAAPADVPGFGEGYGVGGSGYSGGESSAGGWTPFASGGTVKAKKSFMSMKGK